VVNELVAKHYGLKNVKGEAYRKVAVTDGRRGGVLGLGAVHMATSVPPRTSPVLRGAWVLETLLGAPVPSPPPDVPPLKKSGSTKKMTVRQILAKHREHAACAACHNIMDPIGFGMETYDFLGRWRTKDGSGKKIDARGTLLSGETFDGPAGLRKLLLGKEKTAFTRHLIGKLLGYALGRSLIDRDEGTIERLLIELRKNDYASQSLIRAIVLSAPFRYKQKAHHPARPDKSPKDLKR
jgi:hypothetical protein